MNSQLIDPIHRPTINYNQVVANPNTVVFLDNLLPNEEPVDPEQDDFDLGQPASWATRFAGRRHDDGGIISFSDGRAKWVQGEAVVDTVPGSPEQGRAALGGPDFIWDPRLISK